MRGLNRLTARQVQTLGEGYHADGGGLYLQVTRSGARSWIFRYQIAGRRREMGLGSLLAISLAQARDRAAAQRTLVATGQDPIEARAASGEAGKTFGECADAYIASHRSAWKNGAQGDQWEQSLRDHGPARDMPVARVDTTVVIDALSKLWTTKTETGSRVRSRIERVLDYARVKGYRAGENPARWRGHLDKLLPKPSKVAKVRHHPAMPFVDVPAFMTELAARPGRSREALRFAILTAARTEEVVGAPWSEFDLEAGLWSIPEERMKGGRPHVVPLSPAATAIVRSRIGAAAPFDLSEATMLALLQRPPPKGFGLALTVHGFRSSFRDWAAEKTDFPNEVVEMALAHAIRDKAEAAYRRGALLEKRRRLMDAWATFVTGE